MNRGRYLLVLLALLAVAGAVQAASEALYDEKTDAHKLIAAAIDEASKSGKNIVLVFGANW